MGNKENFKVWYEKHKDEYNARRRDKRKQNPEKIRAVDKKYQQRSRYQSLLHYSNGTLSCGRCNFSDIRALSIDHIEGGGYKQRKERNSGNIYNWLKARKFPVGYQVLCMNCQFIKRIEQKETNEKLVS